MGDAILLGEGRRSFGKKYKKRGMRGVDKMLDNGTRM